MKNINPKVEDEWSYAQRHKAFLKDKKEIEYENFLENRNKYNETGEKQYLEKSKKHLREYRKLKKEKTRD